LRGSYPGPNGRGLALSRYRLKFVAPEVNALAVISSEDRR